MRLVSIHRRLLISLILVTFGACVPLIGVAISHLRAAQEAAAVREAAEAAVTVEQMLTGEITRLDTLMQGLSAFPVLVDAAAAGDRVGVGSRLARLHQGLSAVGVTALAVTLPAATVLYRSDSPAVYGDDVSSVRPDLVLAQTEGKLITSVVRVSRDVGLTAAIPLTKDGKRVAVLSAQMDLGQALYDRIRAATGADVVTHVVQSDAFATMGGTLPSGLIPDRELNSAIDGTFKPRTVRANGTPMMVTLLAIRDYSHKPVIVMELLKDRTAMEAVETGAQQALLWTFGVVLLAATGAALLLAGGIARPIRAMILAAEALARGETAGPVPGAKRRDELGALAGALEVLRGNALKMGVMEAKQTVERARESKGRQELLARLAGEIETSVGAVAQDLAVSAHELTGAADGVSQAVAETLQQSGIATAAGDEAASNVQAVASATEQLSASIAEITRQVAESSGVTSRAQAQARDNASALQALTEAASHVSGVVRLISEIASRTNLLALNATIEAARAGEAGRGFAVVAGEVKNLASQTAAATTEVGEKIAQMQEAASRNAESFAEIGRTVATLDEIAGTITTAVGQQSSATLEIARAVGQAAAGTRDAVQAIRRAATGADGASTAAGAVTLASANLERQSGALRSAMGRMVRELGSA